MLSSLPGVFVAEVVHRIFYKTSRSRNGPLVPVSADQSCPGNTAGDGHQPDMRRAARMNTVDDFAYDQPLSFRAYFLLEKNIMYVFVFTFSIKKY